MCIKWETRQWSEWWWKEDEKGGDKNVSKFHHLYSFKNELKCLRFLLTNYVNIVWPIPLFLPFRVDETWDGGETDDTKQQQVKWSQRRRTCTGKMLKTEAKLDGRRKTTSQPEWDETRIAKREKQHTKNGKRVKWIFHELLHRCELCETVEALFFLTVTARKFSFLALARFPRFFIEK